MGSIFKIYQKILAKAYKGGTVNNKLVSKIGRKIHSSIKPEHIEKFGYKLFLDPHDQLMLSVKEYPIHPILKKIIKSGDNVLDVGANIGVLTLYFRSLIGDIGKIYSFEPDPVSFSILKKNIVENSLENIIVENKAVSNKNGSIGFEVSESTTAGRIKEYDDQTLKVNCVTLDSYFSEKLTKINFVKIDTEGFDWTVLEGMKNIISSNPEIKLMVEFHSTLLNESGITPRKFLKIIEDFNFKIYDMGGLLDKFEFLDSQKLEIFAKTPNSSNLLCTRDKINFKIY
jgi:FkbM family methyltransferase